MTRTVLHTALGTVIVLWWLPTIVLALGLLAWRHVAFELRLARACRLRRAGHLDAAEAALQRLRRDLAD